jgi:hypothetical protein
MKTPRLACVVKGSAIILLLLAGVARAAETCEPVVGTLVTVEGRVDVQRTGSGTWSPAHLDQSLCKGDLVRAGQRSRATVQLVNQAVLRIDQNTAMRLDNIAVEKEERSSLSLLQGALQSFSRKPRGFEVSTPYLNGSIEGTEFVFRVKENESELTVFEGTVVAANAQGSVTVSGGESATAMKGQAPQARTVVRPRDVAQWSLYYPPVLAAGNTADAGLQDAAALLSVGRVEEARAGIDRAIQQDPGVAEPGQCGGEDRALLCPAGRLRYSRCTRHPSAGRRAAAGRCPGLGAPGRTATHAGRAHAVARIRSARYLA